MKFRKITDEIDAVVYLGPSVVGPTEGQPVFGEEPPEWLKQALAKPSSHYGSVFMHDKTLYVYTLEGADIVDVNQFIIQGSKGELFTINQTAMRCVYERIDDDLPSMISEPAETFFEQD